ncbi:dihydrolipoamide acetyltransferase [Weissella oryzae SG25]|uniref:Dihydrolipoamide acetyltransferase component of pyruvate dehydrogenase complex n=1 Tax=Weissella oryzae (strain DSM 25784 / JCM 18191 / LMG 30913 / SG25) TaxID=1329250 RepID=A0A069CV22_WEIOS|nr:dihydrolipoamide acetyltransferase family protein [Weissella oryzae]GAK31237.1 dihydrolipoamide acetyltransferase [Weissella oryzae SG25]
MTEIFKMPDIGEGMAEGEITNWLVKVGDHVDVDQEVAEVQNDKLMQEILSPYAGTVTKLYVDAPTVVAVGDPLIEFDGTGEQAAPAPVAATTPVPEAVPAVAAAPTPAVEATPTPAPTVASNGQILAMPSVRHYAHEHNIDLATVVPTGRHGHITLADVQNGPSAVAPTPVAASVATPAPVEPTAPVAQAAAKPAPAPKVTEGRVPMTGIRKAIAKAMENQHTNIPSVTNFDQVEVSKLVAHRKDFKVKAADKGIKLTYLAYVAKALAATVKEYPELNASVDMKTNEIIYHDEVNLGIAVNTDTGLFVPVIANAAAKSIMAIAKEIADLAQAAQDGTLKPAQMQGATITISNIGSARGSWFTPIINGAEVAILGLGSIVKEPIVDADGELAVGQNMKLSLTYDHRLIDGMLAQTATNYLKQLLADPAYMLMEV